jgi:hypothetical protein
VLRIAADSNKAITAHFSPIMVKLDTGVYPTGSGAITPAKGEYLIGSTETVTATPSEGYRFFRWTNDVSGDVPTISIVMDSDKLVGAIFLAEEPPTMEVSYASDFGSDDGLWQVLGYDLDAVYYADGALHIRDGAGTGATLYELSSISLTDFVAEVEVSWVDGSDDVFYGMYFAHDDGQVFYLFYITGDRRYGVMKWVDNEWSTIIDPTREPTIRIEKGQTNVLHMECVGREISLYVNHSGLARTFTIDSDRESSVVGFYAEAPTDRFTTSAFDNFTLSGLTPLPANGSAG